MPNNLANSIGQGSLGGVQWLIIISFLVTLLFGLILAFTRFGRYTYAIGSNPEAAPPGRHQRGPAPDQGLRAQRPDGRAWPGS